MKITVIGAGGVGGWLAARLAAAGTEVHVVARGAHLEAIRAHGLSLISPLGDVGVPVPATDDVTTIGASDAVLFCVKSYDTDAAAAAYLPALVGDGTVVLSLQNGIDNADRLARVVGGDRVIGGLALIASQVGEPGVIVHSGGPARIVFGELDGSPSRRTAELLDALAITGVDARRSDRIREELWDKFAFLCALSGTTATARLPLGAIRASAASWTMFRRLIEEVYAVARASGITPAPDAVQRQVTLAAGLEPHIHASLYSDLVAGRRIELDALHATVARLGTELGVPTPMSTAVEAILRPHAELAEAASTSGPAESTARSTTAA
jgi:2-dehydropantoate 2-reductase